MPVDPKSTAARITAGVNTSEPALDRRLMRSGAENRRDELTAALRARGLQEHAHRAGLARALSLAPNGDVEQVADAFVEQHPAWFRPLPQSTASALVERFKAGETSVQPGS